MSIHNAQNRRPLQPQGRGSRPSALPTAGGGKKSKAITRTFAVLASSDSEEETQRPTLAALNENDPYTQAMSSGSSWGDLALAEEGETPPMRLISPVEWAQRAIDDLAQQTEEIWDQPFARALCTYYADCYNTQALTDDEYEACLTWLYEKGWSVEAEDRVGVKAFPDNLPPRVWISPLAARFEMPVCGHEHRAPPQVISVPRMKKEKKGAYAVPRFCRDAACKDAECRYVHGDTIPRINEPCNFGAACGAADAVKRSQCLRMHPGEVWAADMVIRRPAPVPVPVAL